MDMAYYVYIYRCIIEMARILNVACLIPIQSNLNEYLKIFFVCFLLCFVSYAASILSDNLKYDVCFYYKMMISEVFL